MGHFVTESNSLGFNGLQFSWPSRHFCWPVPSETIKVRVFSWRTPQSKLYLVLKVIVIQVKWMRRSAVLCFTLAFLWRYLDNHTCTKISLVFISPLSQPRQSNDINLSLLMYFIKTKSNVFDLNLNYHIWSNLTGYCCFKAIILNKTGLLIFNSHTKLICQSVAETIWED